ncbi:SGNH/GDSL hydrolase family protein [Actinomycetospora termitidis]|uniref:SGNH/GDSL hydrolase family protein n=1 Tax=Actinomycetospora termitidis TaxID=3053470 RepID=A0ABT7MFV2_9PSEU|nr:SGNH/GDSL hydrolase family protein [Actinomycetospora sp. Odt1-22]MDL5159029.1 SGNH/GDSL hydrolase family protein [Actinomycetospora sp. Odt1-22]
MNSVGTGRRLLVAAIAVVGLLALGTPAALANDGHHVPGTGTPGDGDGVVQYVNMGDSYSAASGVLPPAPGAPPQCLQSLRNWGHLLADRWDYALTDVSCGAAETRHFTEPQYPGVAPQVQALSDETDVVTLTIGGNDSGVFIGTIVACATAAAVTAGTGNPCEQQNGDRFTDTIENVTYPDLVRTLETVKAAAPNARIGIAGYLQILPEERGCYPIMPVAVGDVPYINGIQATLNDAVRRAAEATDVTYIDVTEASQGHDACRPIGTRWVEPGLLGTNPVVVHPNALGEAAMADRAAAELGPGPQR